jgi:hypothetical protein
MLKAVCYSYPDAHELTISDSEREAYTVHLKMQLKDATV